MKILFLCPYPQGEAPSQRFRFEQYLQLLDQQRISFEIHSFLNQNTWSILYSNGKSLYRLIGILNGFIRRSALLFKIQKFDFIFLHREATPLGPPIFEWIIAKIFRKRIIYDFDDAIWLEDPDEQGSLLAKLKWKRKVKQICKWSYKISAGNQYLAEYASQYNPTVDIIPTVVDTENYHNPNLYTKKLKSLPVIGWTGSHSTLGYLNSLIPALTKLHDQFPFILMVISNRKPEFDFQNLNFVPWEKSTEIEALYQMDIGIMPLAQDDWSEGKCGFKIIQYMSLGIPAVASDVGVNRDIIKNNINGYLSTNENEWINSLLKLLLDVEKRKFFGLKARLTIQQQFSVEATSDSFLKLFS